MTWRGLTLLLACASAFAQLPRPQAPPPREGSLTPRLDAVVTDDMGRPVAGLTAADFTLEIDGKPRPIESCEFRSDEPLRLAVLLDDLSLSLERLNAARRALRTFIEKEIRPGDELAVMRASAGTGALDRLTSNKEELERAIDRAQYNPAAADPHPDAFAAGALSVAQGALHGLRLLPGRKALLLITGKAPAAKVDERIGQLSHRAATVFYVLEAGAAGSGTTLEQGLAAAAKETGGRLFEWGDLQAALSRIAQDARSYYLLTYGGGDLPFDYVAQSARTDGLTLRTSRPGASVRARAGVPGEPEVEELDLKEMLVADLGSDGVGLKLTPMLAMGASSWQVEAVTHIDARDLTFVQGRDGLYRATVDTSIALFDPTGAAVREATRSFQTQLPESSFQRYREHGFDYTIVLAVPLPGVYQVRLLTRDFASGRAGTARQFVRVADWKGGGLLMSSIVMRGDIEKDAAGGESTKDPLESGAVRSFKQGHRLTYAYNLYNVAADAEKRSEVETRIELWRNGVRVYAGEPKAIAFAPSDTASQRSVSGAIAVNEAIPPGSYLLRVAVADKLTKHTAWQAVDFEVRP